MAGQVNLSVLNTPDKNLQLIQDNIQKAVLALQTTPFQGGNYLTAQYVGTSPTVINHGLSRTPRIWVIGDQDGAATVFRTDWDNTTITLQASVACTISVWVN